MRSVIDGHVSVDNGEIAPRWLRTTRTNVVLVKNWQRQTLMLNEIRASSIIKMKINTVHYPDSLTGSRARRLGNITAINKYQSRYHIAAVGLTKSPRVIGECGPKTKFCAKF